MEEKARSENATFGGMSEKTIILDARKIVRKIERIAYQIYEEHFGEEQLILVGVAPKGSEMARRLGEALNRISDINTSVLTLKIDKDSPYSHPIELENAASVEGKTIILVDDVLNSGRTLMHAAAHILEFPVKSLHTAVLVDRKHRLFPIRADFVGLTLSTTLQEHISVDLSPEKEAAYLD